MTRRSRGPSPQAVTAAVVIVNHNTADDLLACLATLRHAGADKVVVADSGSTDGSLRAVAEAFPEVTRLALPNLGFGQAANRGVAATGDADVVVVANADTRFRPGGVAAMAQWLRDHPDVGAMGPLIRWPDGRLQLSARAFPSIGTAIGHALLALVKPDNRWTRAYRLTDWDHASERDVDWLSGCCIAVNRTAFDEVGGFDPAYFMFVEDVDLCWRLAQAGWRVVFAPVTEVVHAVGGAVGRRPVRMVVEHARSLDGFFARRYRPGPLARAGIRGGLVLWALSVIVWQAWRGRTHGQAA